MGEDGKGQNVNIWEGKKKEGERWKGKVRNGKGRIGNIILGWYFIIQIQIHKKCGPSTLGRTTYLPIYVEKYNS